MLDSRKRLLPLTIMLGTLMLSTIPSTAFASVMKTTTPVKPATLHEEPEVMSTTKTRRAREIAGAYVEDFSSYTYRGTATTGDWNTERELLRLPPKDGATQAHVAVTVDGSGNTVVAWVEKQRGADDIYARKFDARGNPVWPSDVKVNVSGGIPHSTYGIGQSEGGPALAANDAGDVLVVWYDGRNEKWDLYAQKLKGNGLRSWTVDKAVVTHTQPAPDWPYGIPSTPTVVADGTDFLLTWQGYWNSDWDIYAQRLDSEGDPLWPNDIQVNSDLTGGDQHHPHATVRNGNAVIVWLDEYESGLYDVYAQAIDNDGQQQWASAPRVNEHSGSTRIDQPMAFAAQDGSTLVAWAKSGDLCMQRLSPDGIPEWSEAIDVNSKPETVSGYASRPYYGLAGHIDDSVVLAWNEYDDGDWNVASQRIALDGTKLWTSEIRVNAITTGTQAFPAAAAGADDGLTSIVWYDNRAGDEDIYLQQLDETGARQWSADVRCNGTDGTAIQQAPVVAAGPDHAFAVWVDRRNRGDIYAQKLDWSGTRNWGNNLRVNSGPGGIPDSFCSPAVAPIDGGIVVVWPNRHGDSWDIHAQWLDKNGNRLWAEDVRVNENPGTAWPASATVGVSRMGTVAVTWGDERDGNHHVYAQRLDPQGNRLWHSDVRVSESTGNHSSHAMSLDPDGSLIVVWWDYRPDPWPAAPNVFAQKISPDGNRLWGNDIRVNSNGGYYKFYPDIATDDNGQSVVVWTRDAAGEAADIVAQRLDRDGSRMWPAEVTVNATELGRQEMPYVTVDSYANAYVTWLQLGDERLFAQKLNPSGETLWATDARIDDSAGTASPAPIDAAADGRSIVAWTDARNGNKDVYAQVLNSDGSRNWSEDLKLVEPDDFFFSSGVAESRSIAITENPIRTALLTVDGVLNGGNVEYYLSSNGGVHWEQATPGKVHTFATTGSDLRWRAELTANPVWNRTPVVDSLRIEYSTDMPGADDYEPDDSCAQASPLQVNGAVQAHTFHQPADQDWAWFDAQEGTTYVLQTAHAGPNADTVLELHDICYHPILTDTNAFGRDARLTFTAPSDGTYYARVANHGGSVYGQGTDYDLSVRTYHPNGLAVVVAGRNDRYQLQSNIDYAADQAYLTFLEAGFPKANVRYLGPDPDRDVDGNGSYDDIAATATISNVRYAIQDWPREQGLGLGIPFYVYLMDHGHYDLFLADGDAGRVTAPLLDLWLSNLEATTGADQITVVIDACKSGSFIDVTGVGPDEISGANRVVVASTTSQANAYPSQRGALFSDAFWTALGDNQDVWSAYRTAKAAVDARGLMQTPWLDDNGDAVANDADGDLARGRGLAGVFGGSEPVIDWLEVVEVSASGEATVRAQVRDDFGVADVYVEVYPPGYEEPEAPPGETPVVGVPTTTLTLETGEVYEATLTELNETGSYRVVGYAVDDEGNWALPRWASVPVGMEEKVYLPLVIRGQ